MKVFSVKVFKDEGYNIPNLDPTQYKIDITKTAGGTPRFIKVIHVPTNTDLFTLSYNQWYVDDVRIDNLAVIQDLIGYPLLTSSSRAIASHFLDEIYYKYNPVKILKSNGVPYTKTFAQLRKRLDGMYYTSVTELMKETIINYWFSKLALRNLTEGEPEFTKEFNKLAKNAQLHPWFAYCIITNVKIERVRPRWIYLSSMAESVPINPTIILEDYGYRREVTRRFQEIYLLAHESLWNEQVYDTRTSVSHTCPVCSHTVPTVAWDEEENSCKRCVESRYTIHDYSTKAEQLLSFKAKKVHPKDKPLYLGCELEYETTDKNQAKMKVGKLLAGHAIMKRDGSINDGFEIVTCPATIDIHLEIFKNFFDNKPKEIHKYRTVGMHIHASRAPLSELTIGKLTRFMNLPDNKAFVELIAGRKANDYCGIDEGRSKNLSYAFRMKDRSTNRYNALNLCKKATIEFRIFSTPETYEDFAYKIQFVQALIDYSKPCAIDVSAYAHASWKTFKSWVLKTPRQYPELAAKLKTI